MQVGGVRSNEASSPTRAGRSAGRQSVAALSHALLLLRNVLWLLLLLPGRPHLAHHHKVGGQGLLDACFHRFARLVQHCTQASGKGGICVNGLPVVGQMM